VNTDLNPDHRSPRRRRRLRLAAIAAGAATIGLSIAACGDDATPVALTSGAASTASGPEPTGATPTASGAGPTGATPTAGVAPARPNIVFVLTDDLSMNLIQYMPHVRALQRTGTTFGNYTVTDSLCCPSRSSILAGKFPHNTGVFTNGGQDGGFHLFQSRGEEKDTFATGLQKAGYRTAMMGKYLNGYLPGATVDGASTYVPPGWDEWDVTGNGYPEYNYTLNQNHTLVRHGHAPKDYLTRVLTARGTSFIERSAAADRPFLLEIASFTPHGPFTPDPRDAAAFPGLKAPRTKAFDTLPTEAPPWLARREPLTAPEKKQIDTVFRKRVQDVQSIDRMIGDLQKSLGKAGVAGDTHIVFSSDNGFHLGEYRLNPGKMTAFDTDVRVPLIVSGPGVRRDRVVAEPAMNVDLAPTFEALGGVTAAEDVDGRSLVPLLRGAPAPDWRTASLIEHHGPDTDTTDPDHPAKNSGNPPSYEALRTARATYVEYADGSKEYYDRGTDPQQVHNVVASLPASTRAALHERLARMSTCQGATACRDAAG
jgi:N-acetylglucosamine-6-sulfatase